MKKIIREVDEKKGIVQVTIADERWYMKPAKDAEGMPYYKAVPSITWIGQSYPKGIGYYKWLAEHGWDEAESIKIAAGDKGTKIHLAIEDILQGKEVRIDTKYINKSSDKEEELTLEECDAILSFLKWKTDLEVDYTLETIAFETTVYSDQYNYAGTVDYIVKMTEKKTSEITFWLIDFKSSQQIWPSHELQVSAYKKTIENAENHIPDLDATKLKIGILQVGYKRNKNGYKFTEVEDKFNLFLAAQTIWLSEHSKEEPTKKDYPIVLSKALKDDEFEIKEEKKEVLDTPNKLSKKITK
jgi:hypothetical protein